MTEWIIAGLVMAGFMAQGIGGTNLRFVRLREKWTVSSHGNSLLRILIEWVLAGLVLAASYPLINKTFDLVVVEPPKWVQLASAVLCLLAGLLNGFAKRALGANWFPGVGHRKGHTITTTGPYKFIRHPMYASYWLYLVGFVGVTGGLVVVPAMALIVAVGYASRIKHEERLLSRLRAQQYRNYMAATGRLIPRLRRRRP